MPSQLSPMQAPSVWYLPRGLSVYPFAYIEENKLFIEKYHNYYDTWDSWEPNTPLEIILKNGIDKINK